MTNKIEKILSIEEQIAKLKEKQKRIEQQMHKNIGQEVLKAWHVESEQEAIEWIQKLAGQIDRKEDGNETWDHHEQQS